jgi:hypothetical protein
MEASEGIGEASKLPAARATRAPNEAEHEPLEMEYVVDKAPEHMPAEKPVVKSRNPEPEVSCFNGKHLNEIYVCVSRRIAIEAKMIYSYSDLQ